MRVGQKKIVVTKGSDLIGCFDGERGPVVQSILSITSSLRGQLVKCFTTL